MDHVRHPSCALEEAVGEIAALVVAVPVIGLGQHQTLRCFKAEAVHFRQREQQAGELLPAFDDAEFRSLLDRVGGVEAGIGKADNLGFRALCLQQERGEIRGVQWDADRTEHLAAIGLDEVAGVFFQRVAERVIRGEKNHVSPPALTSEPPVPTASAWVS